MFGTVARLAARLCDLAVDQQILVSHRIYVATEEFVQSASLGEQAIAGFMRPVMCMPCRAPAALGSRGQR